MWDFPLVMAWISKDFWQFSEDFRKLPKMSADDTMTLSNSKAIQKVNTCITGILKLGHKVNIKLLFGIFLGELNRGFIINHVLKNSFSDLWVRCEKLPLMHGIDLFSMQVWDSCKMCENWQVYGLRRLEPMTLETPSSALSTVPWAMKMYLWQRTSFTSCRFTCLWHESWSGEFKHQQSQGNILYGAK